MGVNMALAAMGYESHTAWVSDIEPGPRAILDRRFPTAPNLGDITQINWSEVEPVDVITGGSPCQDLSLSGRRAGMRPGTRSGLWESMLTAIATIRPRLVVWENVRGAYSADAFSLMESSEGRVGDPSGGPVLRALGRVLGDLASIGYDAQWIGLRASDVGAPHQRYRVFVAAHPKGDTWWLQHGDDGPTAHASLRQQREPAERGIRPESDGGDQDALSDSDDEGLEGWWASYERPYEQPLGEGDLGDAGGVVPASWGCTVCGGLDPDCAHCNLFLRVGHSWGRFEPAIRRWELTIHREAPSAVTFNGSGNLELSPYFDEWLMGLPAGWICDLYDRGALTRNQVLRACGNGVVSRQAAHALRVMRDREWQIQRYGDVAA